MTYRQGITPVSLNQITKTRVRKLKFRYVCLRFGPKTDTSSEYSHWVFMTNVICRTLRQLSHTFSQLSVFPLITLHCQHFCASLRFDEQKGLVVANSAFRSSVVHKLTTHFRNQFRKSKPPEKEGKALRNLTKKPRTNLQASLVMVARLESSTKMVSLWR